MTGAELRRRPLAGLLPRAELDVAAAVELVRPICDDVRERGAAAVREHTARFDRVDLPTTLVPREALTAALAGLEPAVRAALTEAVRRARLVHEAQVPGRIVTEVADGSTVTERYVPVARAGVYVPGGLVAYPSSVVMNVVPAQVAGVAEIAVASPPSTSPGNNSTSGLPHPAILAACELLGVTEVHAVGGAQAIAMLGYGTEDCAPVDTITGPGNVYVAAAKRLLQGTVSTDAEAGPTEVAIVADETADPVFVAADLLAQAEHDSLAACLLITTDAGLADRVDAEVVRQLQTARHAGRIKEALSGQSACVLVSDLDAAIAVADAWAPEHLEIQARNSAGLAGHRPQRRSDLRRSLRAGFAWRLPGRLESRAAHRGHREALGRPVGADVPARHPRRGLHAVRARERSTAHRRAGRGRGPGGARQRGQGQSLARGGWLGRG